jgi:hypothetical protein
MSRVSPFLIAILLCPLWLGGQSLGEVAKKEKKRREDNKEKGVKSLVVAPDEVSTENEETEGTEQTGGIEKTVDGSDDTYAPANPDAARQRRDSVSDRQREEALWRSRFSEARARLNAAQERYDALKELHLAPGEYYVDENGRPLIRSLAELRRMTTEAETELNAAKKSLDDMREEARRAGVPPGWLR